MPKYLKRSPAPNAKPAFVGRKSLFVKGPFSNRPLRVVAAAPGEVPIPPGGFPPPFAETLPMGGGAIPKYILMALAGLGTWLAAQNPKVQEEIQRRLKDFVTPEESQEDKEAWAERLREYQRKAAAEGDKALADEIERWLDAQKPATSLWDPWNPEKTPSYAPESEPEQFRPLRDTLEEATRRRAATENDPEAIRRWIEEHGGDLPIPEGMSKEEVEYWMKKLAEQGKQSPFIPPSAAQALYERIARIAQNWGINPPAKPPGLPAIMPPFPNFGVPSAPPAPPRAPITPYTPQEERGKTTLTVPISPSGPTKPGLAPNLAVPPGPSAELSTEREPSAFQLKMSPDELVQVSPPLPPDLTPAEALLQGPTLQAPTDGAGVIGPGAGTGTQTGRPVTAEPTAPVAPYTPQEERLSPIPELPVPGPVGEAPRTGPAKEAPVAEERLAPLPPAPALPPVPSAPSADEIQRQAAQDQLAEQMARVRQQQAAEEAARQAELARQQAAAQQLAEQMARQAAQQAAADAAARAAKEKPSPPPPQPEPQRQPAPEPAAPAPPPAPAPSPPPAPYTPREERPAPAPIPAPQPPPAKAPMYVPPPPPPAPSSGPARRYEREY